MRSIQGRTSAGGLSVVLVAIAVAGATGYLIHLVVPAFTDDSGYIAFSVFWSATFLVNIAVSGVQQEIARASRPRTSDTATSHGRTLWVFAGVSAAVVVIVVAATSPLWAPAVFAAHGAPLATALVVAAAGSTLVAVVTGAYYGLRRWRSVAAIIVGDALLRLGCIALVLAAGLGIVGLAWAIALPFTVAFVGAAVITGRSLSRDLDLDAGVARLARNSLSTVGAATATGVMTSGLPLLLGITSLGADPAMLASLILVITLSRAPLIIPLQAVQSYLIVAFRDAPDRVRGRLVRWGAMLAAVTGILAVAAGLFGPVVLGWLYRGRYALDGLAFAVILASAGFTAVLFLTGPAVLARSAHGWYAAGWATSSAVLVAMLLLPLGDPARVLLAICVAPAVGSAVHVAGLVIPAANARPAEPGPARVD